VKAPQGSAGSSAKYVADVAYLVCEDVCIPGKAKVELSVSLADETKPANKELFDKWVAQIPRPAEGAATMKLERSGDRHFTARFESVDKTAPRDVQWFPVPPKAVSVDSAQTKSDGNDSVFSFALVPPPKEPAAKMQFLVTYTDSNGKRQGLEFTQELPPAAPTN
jgi:DsbC/DsbD-like thiol-disulfide interchange protein